MAIVSHPSPSVPTSGAELARNLAAVRARIVAAAGRAGREVDDVELATALDRHAGALGKRQRVLFQVNVSGEASKSGFTSAELPTVVERLAALPHLQPEGLMTIVPQAAGEEELRGIFRALRLLRDQLAPAFPGGPWRHLSMGMTDDYEIAGEEGATLVR